MDISLQELGDVQPGTAIKMRLDLSVSIWAVSLSRIPTSPYSNVLILPRDESKFLIPTVCTIPRTENVFCIGGEINFEVSLNNKFASNKRAGSPGSIITIDGTSMLIAKLNSCTEWADAMLVNIDEWCVQRAFSYSVFSEFATWNAVVRSSSLDDRGIIASSWPLQQTRLQAYKDAGVTQVGMMPFTSLNREDCKAKFLTKRNASETVDSTFTNQPGQGAAIRWPSGD